MFLVLLFSISIFILLYFVLLLNGGKSKISSLHKQIQTNNKIQFNIDITTNTNDGYLEQICFVQYKRLQWTYRQKLLFLYK